MAAIKVGEVSETEINIHKSVTTVQLASDDAWFAIPFFGAVMCGAGERGVKRILLMPLYPSTLKDRLNTLLSSPRRANVQEAMRLIMNTLAAIDALHQKTGVIHGDLKLDNIFVSPNDETHLSDFGLSTTREQYDQADVPRVMATDYYDFIENLISEHQDFAYQNEKPILAWLRDRRIIPPDITSIEKLYGLWSAQQAEPYRFTYYDPETGQHQSTMISRPPMLAVSS